jgi:uncharacterized membrane protein YuzA (DUF378 family)
MEMLIILGGLVGFMGFAVLATYAFQAVMETPSLVVMPFVFGYELIKYVLLGFAGLFTSFDWNYHVE